MKAAIVLLSRGYPHKEWYGKLIERNNYIYNNFNSKLEKQYPLIIFHEGNIALEHQQFIIDGSKNNDVRFVNIATDFAWPDSIPLTSVQDPGFHLGYRLMCKFNCYHIWDYVKDFDYIFRIDEDTYIGNLDYDVFKYMDDNKLDYLVGRMCEETHPLTNTTIPAVAHALLGNRWTVDMYDQKELWVPYSNLYMARVGLFLQAEVQDFLRKITSNPRFLINRWGDHVVMGIVLKAFSSKDKVSYIKDFEYMHGSHNCISKDGRALEGILSPHEAEVFNLVLSGKQPEHYIARESV